MPTMRGAAWQQVLMHPRRPAANLALTDVSTLPGVYVWFRDSEPVYVGEAKGTQGLRSRLGAHLRTSVDLSRSTLRASVAVHLLGVPRSTARRRPSVMTPEQVASVNQWLRACELAWVVCDDAAAAHQLEGALRTEWLPPLNQM